MLEQHYTDVKIMDSNVENVCKALKKREEKGMNTYGVSTDRTDLTTEEWLQHLQEELMDACVYIEKLKREFQSIPKVDEGNYEYMPRTKQRTVSIEDFQNELHGPGPVSYTHLTLPTSDLV